MNEIKFVYCNDLDSLKRKRAPRGEPEKVPRRRSKTGCLTCRRRKKKCDESFPHCNGCKKNYLNCQWPQNRVARSSSKYYLKSDDNNVTYIFNFASESPGKVIDKKLNIEDNSQLFHSSPERLSISSTSTDQEIQEVSSNPLNDSLVSFSPSSFNILSPFSTWIPGTTLSPDSALLYHTFVNDYASAVSPQLTHPNLTLQAVFIPQGEKSEILREMFYCTAATYLAWHNPEYNEISQRKYSNVIRMIKRESLSGRLDGTEDWFLMVLVCLCTRERHFGESCSKGAQHISIALRIFESTRRKRVLKSLQTAITPMERKISESLIYNYSISILTCDLDTFQQLPDPFTVFDKYNKLLTTELFETPVSWMNSAIMGPGVTCFELIAKSSWISRFPLPLSPEWREIAEDLYKNAVNYQSVRIPEYLDGIVSNKSYESLKYSILISENKAASAKLLLRKILSPDIPSEDSVVQDCVRIVYENLMSIPTGHFTNGISSWSLIVAGSCAIFPEHREMFKEKCFALGELVHGKFYISILDFYEKAWGNENYVGVGCDILLDREALEQVTA